MADNHDPMCPVISTGAEIYWREKCPYCSFISRVREDERKYGMVPGFDLGYAAARRDAVEAVRLSPSADIELVERSQVIDAIEALGGER